MEEIPQLQVLGVSFRSAPLAVRETLGFDAQQATALLRELASVAPHLESAVLSTCNRTEFYLASMAPDSEDGSDALFRILRQLRPHASILRPECRRYDLRGERAVEHILRVGCGLESAVLGDVQILAQLRQCRKLSAQAGTLGKILSHLFTSALEAGKQARMETDISHGNASIGSAIAGMLNRRFHELSGSGPRHILIVGAGDVAASVARHLSKDGAGTLCYVNRNVDRARRLAQLYGGEARPWSELFATLIWADAIIAATSAPQPVLTRRMLDDALRHRGGHAPFVADAGMPRNVEDGGSVRVLNIDGIREQHDEVVRVRQSAMPAVQQLVGRRLQAWQRWRQALPVEAVVKSLYLDLADHQRQALEQLADRPGFCRDDVNRLVIRPMRRVLHQHVTRLRDMHSPSLHDRGSDPCVL